MQNNVHAHQLYKQTRGKSKKNVSKPTPTTTVGDLETETYKHCTVDPPSKCTALPIVSSHGVASWAACVSW
jgi:hypothetical protein